MYPGFGPLCGFSGIVSGAMASRTRIKICGFTRLSDALYAAEAGADALGFVFVSASKRNIEIDEAASICAQVPAFVTKVGLFLDNPAADVHQALQSIPDLVPQFHGNESPDYCQSFARPYIKAVGATQETMPDAATLAAYKSAVGFLYDSHSPGTLGGTGKTFDWSALAHASDTPLILAGGLGVDNIAHAINTVRPYAVDVSSGVEQAKGIKDDTLVRQFIASVRRCDAQADVIPSH